MRKGILMELAESAVERFNCGHSCSQAVFSTLAEQFGLDRDLAVRIAGGFGGGMGRMGATCGAVTGAFMALGLKHGGVETDAKERTYELVRQFAERFRRRHDWLQCRDLLGCDLSTPKGRQEAKDRDTHHTVCNALVRDAAKIAEELLALP